MPVTQVQPTVDALHRFAVTTLAYALAIALIAAVLPALVSPVPMSALVRRPAPVVARVPVAAPATEPAPHLESAQP